MAFVFKISLNEFWHGIRTISDIVLNLLHVSKPCVDVKLVIMKSKHQSTLENVEDNLCPSVSNIQLNYGSLCKNKEALSN